MRNIELSQIDVDRQISRFELPRRQGECLAEQTANFLMLFTQILCPPHQAAATPPPQVSFPGPMSQGLAEEAGSSVSHDWSVQNLRLTEDCLGVEAEKIPILSLPRGCDRPAVEHG